MKASNQIQSIIQCLSQSTIANISLILYVLLSTVVFQNQSILLSITFPTVIALLIQPIILEQVLFKKKIETTKYIFIGLLLLLIIIFATFLVQSEHIITILHFLIIGYSEEVLYRLIIMTELQSSFSVIYSIVISSIFFAIIGHMSEPIIANLVIRFPLGVFLGIIKLKTKSITVSTFFHALYNILLIY